MLWFHQVFLTYITVVGTAFLIVLQFYILRPPKGGRRESTVSVEAWPAASGSTNESAAPRMSAQEIEQICQIDAICALNNGLEAEIRTISKIRSRYCGVYLLMLVDLAYVHVDANCY